MKISKPNAAGEYEEWAFHSQFVYTFTRVLFTIIVRSGIVRLRVSGAEHVPRAGRALIMANHQSNADPLIIGWAFSRPTSIPGKRELFGVPGIGWYLTQLGSYPIDREIADASSLRRTLELLRAGRMLTVFPEGTRTRTGAIGPFESTLAKLAIRERVPIVPVALAGSGGILRPGHLLPHIGSRVGLVFGEPFELTEFYGKKPSAADVDRATDMLRNRVLALKITADALAAS